MARNLTPGDEINGYTIEEVLSRGNLAFAYIATDPDGQRVFLKAFKSPSPLVPWYREFVEYQEAMKQRIESTPLQHFICRILSFFEATVPPRHTQTCYYQVFELVERGHDLARALESLANDSKAIRWERRVTWAKVIMGSIRKMHEHGIVHGDLKPANLMLIGDRSLATGYRLKLIDIDFAVMIDRRAPWHRDMGYVGTPGYFSPEHLAGRTPEPASDVFTCGIILSELLSRQHPFVAASDDAHYRRLILEHAAPRIALDGRMPDGNDGDVVEVVHQMLHPEPAQRPRAESVLKVLNGFKHTAELKTIESGRLLRVPGPPPPAPPALAGGLRLRFGDFVLTVAITTKVNRRLIDKAGIDSQYWDPDHQFTLERKGGQWYVIPNTTARNETLHNGRAVTESVSLQTGDQLAVGRQARGVVKAPAQVILD